MVFLVDGLRRRPADESAGASQDSLPDARRRRKRCFSYLSTTGLDQWRTIKPVLAEYFNIDESLYTSILPTATQYAKRHILRPDAGADRKCSPNCGLTRIRKKEKYQRVTADIHIAGALPTPQCFSYSKINDGAGGERLLREFGRLEANDLNVIVFNFIDMMSHARTESKMIRELASTNAAYRSLTEAWFRHSSALEIFAV